MKILAVSSYGDAERGVDALVPLQLGRRFVRQGHSVDLLLPQPARGQSWPDERDGVRFLSSAALRAPRVYLASYFVSGIPRIVSLARRRKYDIIHCFCSLPAFMSVTAKRASGLGALVDFYHWEPWETLQVYLSKWRPSGFRAMVSRYILSETARSSDIVVASSPELALQLASLGAHNVKVVPYAVDIDQFTVSAGERSIRDEFDLRKPVVLFSGKLHGVARVDKVVRAFSRMLLRVPSATLLIVGDGSQRVELESLSRHLGIEDSVVFAGLRRHEEIPGFVASCDLAAAPMELEYYVETGVLPVKLLEYMAGGRPVVTQEGFGKLREGEGVVAVNFDRPNEAGDLMADLCLDRERLRILGEKARIAAERHYSYDVVAECYLRIYEERLE